MFLPDVSVYEYIVKVHYYKLVRVVFEHVVHYVHESRWCISETKRDDSVFIVPIPCIERCFWYNFSAILIWW